MLRLAGRGREVFFVARCLSTRVAICGFPTGERLSMLPELDQLRAKNSSKVQPISIGRTRMKLRPRSLVPPAEVGV
jgi:hypothetical protein